MSSPLVTEFELRQPLYAGLRLTADEFFELQDDGFRYELIDGVMVMTSGIADESGRYPLYAGLRLSAEEYFELEDDGFRYELINGVMVMSPSPMPLHQGVVVALITQLSVFLGQHGVGRVYPDVDVKLVKGLT